MTSAPLDPISRLEHDHQHLNRLVSELREAMQAAMRGELAADDLRDQFDEFRQVLQEELYDHFAREEEVLFPYLVQHLPDLADRIGTLETAHDRICGIASRMEHLVRQSPAVFESELDALVALFARFDANFVKHARDERDLLRDISSRLDRAQRAEVARMLAEL